MRIENFDVYKDLLIEKSGLVLSPDKSYLLESRLTPIAKQWGFETLDQMSIALRGVPDPGLIKAIIEAMTTSETTFYRDLHPFVTLRDIVIPHLQNKSPQKGLRIWCAGAASGQEPYSIALTIKEHGGLAKHKLDIIGTDISSRLLETAKEAAYTQFDVQRGISTPMLLQYFDQKEDRWHLKSDIKDLVQFKYFNMMESMDKLGQFDVIFCRNVLSVFDKKSRTKILLKLKDRLTPDGYLFLGNDEDISGLSESLMPAADLRGVYLPAGAKMPETASQSA